MTTIIGIDFTTDAEAEAIRREHKRRQEQAELLTEYRAEQQRKKRQSRIANAIAAGLVLIFLLLAILWGAR